MCMARAKEWSAKGSNFKEDDSALVLLYELYITLWDTASGLADQLSSTENKEKNNVMLDLLYVRRVFCYSQIFT